MMFYLNVFYLPVLKQVVGQHKMWNDVMFWFSQMIFYNANFPLLIRQANDVEENPGPTIFDVIEPTRTIYVLTSVKEMKLSLLKMLVSNV